MLTCSCLLCQLPPKVRAYAREAKAAEIETAVATMAPAPGKFDCENWQSTGRGRLPGYWGESTGGAAPFPSVSGAAKPPKVTAPETSSKADASALPRPRQRRRSSTGCRQGQRRVRRPAPAPSRGGA